MARISPREPWHDAVLRVGALALRAWGVGVRVTGAEHLPADGPVVLAGNHVSYPDFVVLQKAALPVRRIRFLCRADIFDVPLVGGLMRRMRHVPVDRTAPAAAYLEARRLLQEGETVGIFPEAGVSRSLTLRPLMRGAAHLAAATGAPLVPVGIWGGQRLWQAWPGPDGRRPRPDPRRGRVVDVRFGVPIGLAPGSDPTAATVRLGVGISALVDELAARPEHEAPPGPAVAWLPAHLGGSAPLPAEAWPTERLPASAVPVAWGSWP